MVIDLKWTERFDLRRNPACALFITGILTSMILSFGLSLGLFSCQLAAIANVSKAKIAPQTSEHKSTPDALTSEEAACLKNGISLFKSGEYLQASTELERAVNLNPKCYEAWSALADIYQHLHEDEKAAQAQAKASHLEPTSKAANIRLLKNLRQAGHTDKACAEVNRLLAEPGTSAGFCQELAEEALALGALDQAIQASQRVLAERPQSNRALRTLCFSQFFKHDYAGCAASAEKILTSDKNQKEAQILLSLSQTKLDSATAQTDNQMSIKQQAEKRIESLCEENSDLPMAKWALGFLRFDQGNYELASELLQSAFDAEPSMHPELCYILACALDKSGLPDDSLQYYKLSLRRGLSGDDEKSARAAVERIQNRNLKK
jgi:tetratricopeptide (TPR) repeat protein